MELMQRCRIHVVHCLLKCGKNTYSWICDWLPKQKNENVFIKYVYEKQLGENFDILDMAPFLKFYNISPF